MFQQRLLYIALGVPQQDLTNTTLVHLNQANKFS